MTVRIAKTIPKIMLVVTNENTVNAAPMIAKAINASLSNFDVDFYEFVLLQMILLIFHICFLFV